MAGAAMTAGFLAACGGPSGGRQARPVNPADDPMTGAIAMKDTKGCEAAMPLLRKSAEFGRGFEIVQFHLGDCLMRLATRSAIPEEAAEREREALQWLRLAADSGEPNAQGALAALRFQGGDAVRDRIAAAKWLILYLGNPVRVEIGARPLTPGLETDIRRTLTDAEWKEAEARAGKFIRQAQDIKYPDPRAAASEDGQDAGDNGEAEFGPPGPVRRGPGRPPGRNLSKQVVSGPSSR